MADTEIEITADLVRDLLQEQHPDLAGLAIREVAGGWGNQMWRLGDELAVRMQRMDRTPELQLKERRWLPVLAPRLPLPVPLPVRFGDPSERFPRHWTVMTWVPGEPLDHGSISRGAHAADMLAGFLRALHVEAPAEAPIATDRGAHPRNCTDGFDHFFHAVAPDDDVAADVRAVWDDAVAAPEWEGCCATRWMSTTASLSLMTCGCGMTPAAVGRRGHWCSRCRLRAHGVGMESGGPWLGSVEGAGVLAGRGGWKTGCL
ncbi:phosphotransferase [Streptomyces sp. NBC_01613]|uniref:phosphotransferase n=1 Tax=Streptomyces sp. NBC_01613 TaxID=2975896 RepID=UPI003868B7FD